MITAIDCHYETDRVWAAACAVSAAADKRLSHSLRIAAPCGDAYQPGAFYRRELPAIIALLEALTWQPSLIFLDSYIDLDVDRPGLGRHLITDRQPACPLIGVAKNRFASSNFASAVCRGGSAKPLYVTCHGIERDAAIALLSSMYGPHRLPMLLKAADSLARGHQLAS